MIAHIGLVIALASCAAVMAPIAHATEDGLPAQMVNAVRSATVFIKVTPDFKDCSGSGIVVSRRGKGVLIATTASVVPAYFKDISVWFSGDESKKATYQATIAACDDDLGITLLQVDLPRAPIPLPLAALDSIRETSSMLAAGCGNLFPSFKDPAWMRKAKISSLRYDNDGQLILIQVDGVQNLEMGGGPLVTPGGALVGMMIGSNQAAGIGFAMPYSQLRDAMTARVRHCQVEPASGNPNNALVTADLYDPFKLVRSVTLLIGNAKNAHPARVGSDGCWRLEIDQPRVQTMKMLDGCAQVDISLSPAEVTESWYQVQLILGSGKEIFGKPAILNSESTGRHSVELPAPIGSPIADEPSVKAAAAVSSQFTTASLLGPKRQLGDCAIQDLSLPEPAIADQVLWSHNGQTSYLLCSRIGTVIRASLPSLSNAKWLEIGQHCRGMALAKGGLLVAIDALREVWLLDPITLSVRSRYCLDGYRGIAANPSQALALVTSGRILVPIDTISGKMMEPLGSPSYQTTRDRDFWVPGGQAHLDVNMPVLSEDGNVLFALSDYGDIRRYRIGKGVRIEGDGQADLLGSDPLGIILSSDGKDVSLLCRDGYKHIQEQHHPDGHVIIKVFGQDNLNSPRLALSVSPSPSCFIIDSASQRFITNSDRADLVVYDKNGARTSMIQLEEGSAPSTTCLRLQPLGHKIWVLGRARGWLVEIPE